MIYVTGIFALNLDCGLNTPGDWHCSALRWDNVLLKESNDMFFGDYGIELNKTIPCHREKYAVANHIRALLDILEMGNYPYAQGMNKSFISDSKFDNEIFDKVYSMKVLPNWAEIDDFMGKEYMMKWINYKAEVEPPKTEVSFRRKVISPENVQKINGITVYNIDALCRQKALAYAARDRIRDLYDLTFIVNNRFDELSNETKDNIALAFEHKGLDYVDYLLHTQKDELIDDEKFLTDFLSAYDRLGLLSDAEIPSPQTTKPPRTAAPDRDER